MQKFSIPSLGPQNGRQACTTFSHAPQWPPHTDLAGCSGNKPEVLGVPLTHSTLLMRQPRSRLSYQQCCHPRGAELNAKAVSPPLPVGSRPQRLGPGPAPGDVPEGPAQRARAAEPEKAGLGANGMKVA